MSHPRIQTAAPAVDGISSLPEAILCHILSFLPTKEAVATSVLAKRWTNLWLSVDTISFTDIQINSPIRNYTFNESVYSVLVSRDVASAGGSHLISRFCLEIVYSNSHLCRLSFPNIIKWVNLVVQRKLKHLRLHLHVDDDADDGDVDEYFIPKLPLSVFTCKTLVNQPQCPHDVTIFHNLTQLRLYDRLNMAAQVLQHCPKLQNLVICKYDSMENEEDDQENWVEPEIVPQCLLSSLITCTIHDLSGLPCDFLLLAKYILRNSKILRNMTISSNREPLEMERKLSPCPKASITCQLFVY